MATDLTQVLPPYATPVPALSLIEANVRLMECWDEGEAVGRFYFFPISPGIAVPVSPKFSSARAQLAGMSLA